MQGRDLPGFLGNLWFIDAMQSQLKIWMDMVRFSGISMGLMINGIYLRCYQTWLWQIPRFRSMIFPANETSMASWMMHWPAIFMLITGTGDPLHGGHNEWYSIVLYILCKHIDQIPKPTKPNSFGWWYSNFGRSRKLGEDCISRYGEHG